MFKNYKRSSFNALLEKDGFVSIHKRNIKILATLAIYSKYLARPQMHEIFKLKDFKEMETCKLSLQNS